MKTYEVTLYYHTSITVVVNAENEHDAIASAYCEAGDDKYDSQFILNAQEDGTPDIKEI